MYSQSNKFIDLCRKEKVKYIDELMKITNIYIDDIEKGFDEACKFGYLTIVKYIISNKLLPISRTHAHTNNIECCCSYHKTIYKNILESYKNDNMNIFNYLCEIMSDFLHKIYAGICDKVIEKKRCNTNRKNN